MAPADLEPVSFRFLFRTFSLHHVQMTAQINLPKPFRSLLIHKKTLISITRSTNPCKLPNLAAVFFLEEWLYRESIYKFYFITKAFYFTLSVCHVPCRPRLFRCVTEKPEAAHNRGAVKGMWCEPFPPFFCYSFSRLNLLIVVQFFGVFLCTPQ